MGAPINASSRLPDFIAVGPPRTGTTWLHRVLTGHVGLPSGIKETQFFAWNYELGLQWYLSYFRDASPDLPLGEIAPTYFDHPQARSRIAEVIPGCRIICSLRDPVERVYSQYKVWLRAGLVEGPFDYAAQRTRLAASASYASNLRAWMSMFDASNVLVTLYDDLRADPQAYIDSICGFIGIPRVDLSGSPRAAHPVNRSQEEPRSMMLARQIRKVRDQLIRRRYRLARLLEAGSPLWNLFFTGGKPYPPLDPAVDRRLRALLLPEIEDLESVLGRDLSAWKLSSPERAERIAAKL
jgi:hypothetical protein